MNAVIQSNFLVVLALLCIFLHQVISKDQCPEGYVLNPLRLSCVQLIRRPLRWADAKAYCEYQGEHLITTSDLNSMFWLQTQRKIRQDWPERLWYGAKRDVNGTWRWQDEDNMEMLYGLWAISEPDNSGDCLQGWVKEQDYKFADHWCGARLPFLCEVSSSTLQKKLNH